MPRPTVGSAGSVGASNPGRRFAKSDVTSAQNLASLLLAFGFAVAVLLLAVALGVLIATALYGYGGI